MSAGAGRASARWDLRLLLALLAVVLGAWLFIVLASEVAAGSTEAVDVWLLEMARDPEDPARLRGPFWVGRTARDVSALGSSPVLGLFVAIAAGWLFLQRRRRLCALLVLTVAGGLMASSALKSTFGRVRPDVVPHLEEVTSRSFPSGHAMGAAIVYLTLGALLARSLQARRLKLYAVVVGASLTLAVGVTRVLLGVHYPSDVLGGWTAGLIWSIAAWLLARRLQHRGSVEGPLPRASSR